MGSFKGCYKGSFKASIGFRVHGLWVALGLGFRNHASINPRGICRSPWAPLTRGRRPAKKGENWRITSGPPKQAISSQASKHPCLHDGSPSCHPALHTKPRVTSNALLSTPQPYHHYLRLESRNRNSESSRTRPRPKTLHANKGSKSQV